MAITTKEVISRQDLRRFVRFPNELYADNEYYVPQIESMEMDTLTPGKNRAFEVCEGKYWLAYDENGKIVGRVAGIINYKYNKKVEKKICRFCWIDFIESQEVVHALTVSLSLTSPEFLSKVSTNFPPPTESTTLPTTSRCS